MRRHHAANGAVAIADRAAIAAALAGFQSRGLRTFGFAYRPAGATRPKPTD